MADEPEEVLELEPEDEIGGEDQPIEGDADETDEQDGETVPFIGFEGEDEAAPASESESSVIRELRKANREQAKRIAELERGSAPAKVEVGDEPTLEGCDYDEDKFKDDWSAWKSRKAAAAAQDAEEQQATERRQTEMAERARAYEAGKIALNVPGFDDAEGEVFAALPAETKALLLMSEKPAALVYALSKSPSKLEELSKLNLPRAAMMIGKLEDKVQMGTRRLPDPDRPVKGNAAPTTADKELARLEKEADRTGDRTKLIAYRKAQRSKP